MSCSLTPSPDRLDLSPSVWGRKTWAFLWASALSYPETPSEHIKQSYRTLLHHLPTYLPCASCRHNSTTELSQVDVNDAVSSGVAYRRCILSLYNSVATRLNHRRLIDANDATSYLLLSSPPQRFCADGTAVTLIVVVVVLALSLVAILWSRGGVRIK